MIKILPIFNYSLFVKYSLFASFVVLLTVTYVYAQTDEKTILKQTNQSFIAAYQKRDFKEAEKFALEAINLSLQIFGNESIETAIAYKNLGVLFQDQNKFEQSIEYLEKSQNIFETNSVLNAQYLVDIYKTLAISYTLAGKLLEADKNYLKNLEITEKTYGRDSKQTLNSIFNLAEFYADQKDFDKANPYYLRSYELVVKNYGKDSPELDKIDDKRALRRIKNDEKEKQFQKEVYKLYGIELGTVINGKAIKLVEPEYPKVARAVRAGGAVSVRVKIDENGNVAQARASSGHPLLRANAVEAAFKSKFSITYNDGKPMSVRGIIVYNFIVN